jgi:hypothetical protein
LTDENTPTLFGAPGREIIGNSNSSPYTGAPLDLQAKIAKRGGARPRAKGSRVERHLVHLLQDAGLDASRVPLSGSAGGKFAGDITVPLLGRDLVVEVKARADGFRELYQWLDGRDVLVVKSDRRPPLLILPMRLAIEIARAAEE